MKYLKRKVEREASVVTKLEENVKKIIDDVKKYGDETIINLNKEFDGCVRDNLRITPEEIKEAYSIVDPQLVEDIKYAAENIRNFAIRQKESKTEFDDYEVVPGVFLGQRIVPIDEVACYVPGGNYPLYSTALMLIIPAKVAGVNRVVACSPAMSGTNKINPATLVAMDISGVDEIYIMGGAQSIAALTYGTEQIKSVDKIVGPGNSYVTEAKRQCFGPVGIDFLAGPSEVLIIADETGNPKYLGADILAQCEHDYEARGIVITTDEKLGNSVIKEVERQLEELDTKEIAGSSWRDNGEVIVVDTIEEACKIANDIAPEHLEIHVKDEESTIEQLTSYGSLFIGQNAAEVFGDYVSGPNHTLPTMRAARYTGGVSVDTFLKTLTQQRISKEGIDNIAGVAYRMAIGESLVAHAAAAKIRMKK